VSRPTVYTARIGYQGADALDVSRKSGNELGLAFAPSWSILGPALAKRRDVGLSDTDWTAYVEAYTAEMRASYRDHGDRWNLVLLCAEVTVLCYCTDALRCHRTVLARDILPRFGCAYGGERGHG
jgi:hypothetical protein